MADKARLLETFLKLVRINSPSGAEKPLADLLVPELEELGFETLVTGIPAGSGSNTGNIIARKAGTVEGVPCLMLCAHMDTIRPTEGLNPHVAGDTVKTDGSTILGADDKSGIAVILEAVESVLAGKRRIGDLEVVFTVAEETGLYGAKGLRREDLKAHVGYVFDEGNPIGSPVTQAPSHDKIYATVRGRAAHAGVSPEKGLNAIEVASSAIAKLKTGRVDEETTTNVGVISGGQATNIVPEECRVDIEARSRDEGKLSREVEKIKRAFEETAAQWRAFLDLRVERCYDTYSIGDQDLVLKVALEASEALGLSTLTRATGGGSDANVFNSLGIPTLVLGTGMTNVHTTSESISVSDMLACAQHIEKIIELVAGKKYIKA
jgi:tripeptide aminopeptidase